MIASPRNHYRLPRIACTLAALLVVLLHQPTDASTTACYGTGNGTKSCYITATSIPCSTSQPADEWANLTLPFNPNLASHTYTEGDPALLASAWQSTASIGADIEHSSYTCNSATNCYDKVTMTEGTTWQATGATWAGGAAEFTPTQSGDATVNVSMRYTQHELNQTTTSQVIVAITFVPVLTASIASNASGSPSIAPNLCQNAQDEYKYSSWGISLNHGGSGVVSVVSGPVQLSSAKDGSYSSSVAVSDQSTVWAKCTSTSGTGSYTLRVIRDDNASVTDEGTGTVFKFLMKHSENSDAPSKFGTHATAANGAVSSDGAAPKAEQWARIIRDCDAWVETQPAGQYGGKVNAQVKVKSDFSSECRIIMGAASLNIEWKIKVKVKIPGLPGDWEIESVLGHGPTGSDYSTCVTGLRANISLDNATGIGVGKQEFTNADGDLQSIWPWSTKSWQPVTTVTNTQDAKNQFTVPTSKANFKVEIESGSNGSDPIAFPAAYGNKSYADSDLSITNIEVTENDGVFEIIN